jgi:endonuclease/exonuclease/phosphatase family metal-dependent hydrolase
MTCNIRYFGAPDGENHWTYRRNLCAEVIRSRSPHVICFQEVAREQFLDLARAFPDHATFGTVDEPQGHNPVNAIFYRRDAFELISAGAYWLSQTPHIAGTRSWDSDCVRLANWVYLLELGSRHEFRVINTHLDHVSQVARENQARLLTEDAGAYADAFPQLLTGDMNCDTTNRAIAILQEGGWRDTYGAVHGPEDPGHTFHRFLGPAFSSSVGKMDWIMARGGVTVLGAEVVRDAQDGRFPSDHYFVSAEVSV